MDLGGLGIKRIKDINVSLLFKWWWKFGCEVNALWRRLLCSKYMFEENNWIPTVNSSSRYSRIWSDILATIGQNQPLKEFYLVQFQIKVGNGCRIKFWHDKWAGVRCLKDEYPRLFSLSNDKEATLSIFYARKSSLEEWKFSFRRDLYDWEKAEVTNLVAGLGEAPSLSIDVEDCAVRKGSTDGSFKVSDIYSFTDSPLGPHLKICKFVWNKSIPPKVQFLGWLAWRNRVKTGDLLKHIGVLHNSDSILCVFCNTENESASHVLLHCPFSWKVWSDLLLWWGCFWVVPRSINCLFHWWLGWNHKKLVRRLWRDLPSIAL
ncbi:unnamed protein product [Camellia sinensis]